jgi:hypothetical protein
MWDRLEVQTNKKHNNIFELSRRIGLWKKKKTEHKETSNIMDENRK